MPAAPDSAPAAIRLAASLVVVRDGPGGLEVLLLQRAERGDFNSGAWVFPGGVLDAADHAAATCCTGLDDDAANRLLGLPQGGLAHAVAAVRECFEETGLLYAVDAGGRPVEAGSPALEQERRRLHHGECSLPQLCAAHGWRLALDRLAYLSHWLTPPGRDKRFDTRFFLAELPAGQQARHDAAELVAQRWLRPAEALAAGAALKLMTPTLHTLQTLARFDTAAAALAWARTPREVQCVMPRLGRGADGKVNPVTPDEPAYAELGRLDPQGRGSADAVLVPGRAVRLSPTVLRVTAANGSMMTGPGTNTYLLGHPGQPCAVLDPGPADEAHLQAVLAAAPGPVGWILVTHTHPDHSPGAAWLHARTGAPVLGRRPTYPERQDATFAPTRELQHGERLALADGLTLRVLHTPGHASNHLCYLLEQEQTLFTGDHLMQRSTVVINPPDGDMAAYLASLRALLHEPLAWLAPGHGFLMDAPHAAIEAVIAHRLRREAKVVDALAALGTPDDDALLAQVYADVPAALQPPARRSLAAHLLKLQAEGRVLQAEGRWRLAGDAPATASP